MRGTRPERPLDEELLLLFEEYRQAPGHVGRLICDAGGCSPDLDYEGTQLRRYVVLLPDRGVESGQVGCELPDDAAFCVQGRQSS